MDCAKLASDIKNLKEAKDTFAASIESFVESGNGKIGDIRAHERRVDELRDSILEEYLGDFVEKNPDIFRYKFGETIHDCGRPVNAFLELDNGDIVLACGDFTEGRTHGKGSDASIVILRKQEDGSYRYLESHIAPAGKISCMEQADDSTIFYGGQEAGIIHIEGNGHYSIDPFEARTSLDEGMKKMPNGDVIVMRYGEPVIIRKNSFDDGIEYEPIKSIERNTGEVFSTILPISDTELLIGGAYLLFATKDSDGVYRQYDALGGTGEYNGLLAPLDNGDILVAGGENATERCDLRILHMGKFGPELSESIFSSFEGYPRAVMQLPNGDIVVTVDSPSTDRSHLRILRRRDDGSYDTSGVIECGAGSESGSLSYKLKDGRVLCDANWGRLCFLQDDSHPDLEKLKNELGKIVSYGKMSPFVRAAAARMLADDISS